jgi:hypothetical protein
LGGGRFCPFAVNALLLVLTYRRVRVCEDGLIFGDDAFSCSSCVWGTRLNRQRQDNLVQPRDRGTSSRTSCYGTVHTAAVAATASRQPPPKLPRCDDEIKFDSSLCSLPLTHTNTHRYGQLGLAIDTNTSMPPPDAGYPAWQSAPLRTNSSTHYDGQNKARDAPTNDENLASPPAPTPPPPPPPPSTPPTSFSRSWRGKLAYGALVLLGVGLVVAAFVPVSTR